TTLAGALRPRALLLLLDNCEHLLTACAGIAETLLRGCPNLRVLATSREALGVAGEGTLRVPSLSLPDAEDTASVDRAAHSEAMSLFLSRAALAAPGFELDEANLATVVQVCRRLDGIPLAIELAAARLRALPLDEIASRLDDRFHLLTGGSRTA